LRYEVQNLNRDEKDWAPRFGFAWAPGTNKNGPQKTVIRGGSGIFYDRVALSPYEQAALNNGHTQLEYTVYNPEFYLNDIPSPSTLSPGQNSIYDVDPKLRADYSIQSAIGVERQLPHNTTTSLTYTNTHAEHYLQTVPINAPLPGTFNPLLPLGPNNGVFPFGYDAGNIFEYESGGILRQNILMATVNTRFSRRVSLYANYQLTYANDLPSNPTDPYDFRLDYGRSTLDRRHNLQIFGSIQAPGSIYISPFITIRSGMPYDVLSGIDEYGDHLGQCARRLRLLGRDFPETSWDVVETTGERRGADFSLQRRHSCRRSWFLPPETLPAGTVPCSSRPVAPRRVSRAARVASSSQRLLSACEAWPFVQTQFVLCRATCSSSSSQRSLFTTGFLAAVSHPFFFHP
jgi:hypothetical protein